MPGGMRSCEYVCRQANGNATRTRKERLGLSERREKKKKKKRQVSFVWGKVGKKAVQTIGGESIDKCKRHKALTAHSGRER